MDKKALEALADIAKVLGINHDCSCGECCDCTTPKGHEATATRYNDQSAFASAESQKQYLQHRDLWFGEMLRQVRT